MSENTEEGQSFFSCDKEELKKVTNMVNATPDIKEKIMATAEERTAPLPTISTVEVFEETAEGLEGVTAEALAAAQFNSYLLANLRALFESPNFVTPEVKEEFGPKSGTMQKHTLVILLVNCLFGLPIAKVDPKEFGVKAPVKKAAAEKEQGEKRTVEELSALLQAANARLEADGGNAGNRQYFVVSEKQAIKATLTTFNQKYFMEQVNHYMTEPKAFAGQNKMFKDKMDQKNQEGFKYNLDRYNLERKRGAKIQELLFNTKEGDADHKRAEEMWADWVSSAQGLVYQWAFGAKVADLARKKNGVPEFIKEDLPGLATTAKEQLTIDKLLNKINGEKTDEPKFKKQKGGPQNGGRQNGGRQNGGGGDGDGGGGGGKAKIRCEICKKDTYHTTLDCFGNKEGAKYKADWKPRVFNRQ